MNIPAFVVFIILSLAGLLGIFIPALPDTILIFAGGLIYAIVTKFESVSYITIIILGTLSALSYLLDFISSVWGAKKFGASKTGVYGSVIGGIVGFFAFSILGLLVGAVLGTIIAEIYFARKKYEDALKAGLGVLAGVIFSAILKTIIAIAMIVLVLKDIF